VTAVTLPSPSSSSSFDALQHNPMKKATTITLLPSSSFFFAAQTGAKKIKKEQCYYIDKRCTKMGA